MKAKQQSNVVLVILLMGTWHGMINSESAGGAPWVLGCKLRLKFVQLECELEAHTPDEHAMACTKPVVAS